MIMHRTSNWHYSPLQFMDGTVITNPRFFKKIFEGCGFSASHRFEGVDADGSIEMLFDNAEESGKVVFNTMVDIISTGQAWVDIYRDNEVTLAGTGLTPINLNFESANTSVSTIEYGGNYTAGDLVHSTVIPGGDKIRAVGAESEIGETVILPEGFNFLVKVVNKSASAEDISIRMIWWEEKL